MSVSSQLPHHRAYSLPRMAGALVVALGADIVNAFTSGGELTPAAPAAMPLDLAVDGATALILWLVLGRPTLLLPALVLEAIPGIGMAPFWVVAVVGILLAGPAPQRQRAH